MCTLAAAATGSRRTSITPPVTPCGTPSPPVRRPSPPTPPNKPCPALPARSVPAAGSFCALQMVSRSVSLQGGRNRLPCNLLASVRFALWGRQARLPSKSECTPAGSEKRGTNLCISAGNCADCPVAIGPQMHEYGRIVMIYLELERIFCYPPLMTRIEI